MVAFGGVLVASRMCVSTSALLSCYERVFLTKKNAYFMISESWTFGLQNLFVRTREPFFSNLRTFGLKNLRTHEPSNLRTFGLIGCNPVIDVTKSRTGNYDFCACARARCFPGRTLFGRTHTLRCVCRAITR